MRIPILGAVATRAYPSVKLLPGWAETATRANPIFYMVNVFRYGLRRAGLGSPRADAGLRRGAQCAGVVAAQARGGIAQLVECPGRATPPGRAVDPRTCPGRPCVRTRGTFGSGIDDTPPEKGPEHGIAMPRPTRVYRPLARSGPHEGQGMNRYRCHRGCPAGGRRQRGSRAGSGRRQPGQDDRRQVGLRQELRRLATGGRRLQGQAEEGQAGQQYPVTDVLHRFRQRLRTGPAKHAEGACLRYLRPMPKPACNCWTTCAESTSTVDRRGDCPAEDAAIWRWRSGLWARRNAAGQPVPLPI